MQRRPEYAIRLPERPRILPKVENSTVTFQNYGRMTNFVDSETPTRAELQRRRRRLFWRDVELMFWRAGALSALALTFMFSPETVEVVQVRFDQRFIDSPLSEGQILRQANKGASAMVIEVAHVDPTREQVERWSATMERLSRKVPVAVALSSDVSADTLAIVVPVQRIYGLATALITPGGLEEEEAPAQDKREALYRRWLYERINSYSPAAGAALLELEDGEPIGGQEARAAGLIDKVGYLPDATEWAILVSRGKLAARQDPDLGG